VFRYGVFNTMIWESASGTCVLAFVVGIVSVLFIFILLYGYIGDERGIPPLDEASFPAPRLY